MASSAASESILFIAAIVVTTAFVGVLSAVVTEMSGDVRERGTIISEELRTDITIINDPANVDVSPLTLYVKNTGKQNLLSNLTEVLVDGVISTDRTFDVIDSSDDINWRIGEVVEITVNDITPAAGDHRVRVVAQNGVADELLFNV